MFGFFSNSIKTIKEAVTNTTKSLVTNVVNNIAEEEEFSEFVLDDMEDLLISADLGVNYAGELVDKLRNQDKIKPSVVKQYLKDEFEKVLNEAGSTVLNYKDGELNTYFIWILNVFKQFFICY